MKNLFTAFLILFALTSSAQEEYLLKNGRKITSVDVMNRFGHSEYSKVTINTVEGMQTFTPEELEGYAVNNRLPFITKEVMGERRFVQVMYESPIMLFKYIDEKEKTIFYIENERGFQRMIDETYHDVLEKYWPDCLHKEILDNILYDVESLIGVIKMINTCEEVYVPIPRSYTYLQPGLEKAIGVVDSRVMSQFPRLIYLLEDWTPLHYSYGAGFMRKKPIGSNYIGVNYGFEAAYSDYDGVDIFPLPDGSLQENRFLSETFNIAIPITFELSRKVRKVVSSLEFGVKPSYNISNVGEEVTIISNAIGQARFNNDVKVQDNLNFGILGGVGAEFPILGKEAMVNLRAELRLGTTTARIHNKMALHLNLAYRVGEETVRVKQKKKADKRKKRRDKMDKKRTKKRLKMEVKRKKKAEDREKKRIKMAEKREKDRVEKAAKRAKDKAKRDAERLKKEEERAKKGKKKKNNQKGDNN